MRGLDRVPNLTPPPDDASEDASAPCPFCGCRHHITAGPGVHAPHRCCGCGRRFDDRRVVCSRCGSPGEHLGDVIAPNRGLYAQYRCYRCGHRFMVRIEDDD